VLVEVGLEPVECPRGVGQAEGLRIGQGGGEDLGDLLGGVDGGASGAGLILQAGGPLEVEPADPAVDGGAGDAELAGGGGDFRPVGQGGDDAGALDGAGLGGAGAGQRLDGLPLLGRQWAE
jgi:hypothetical protein